jgi:hypothetical protein
MATLIQSMQNLLSQKDPLLANETKRVILGEGIERLFLSCFSRPDSGKPGNY